MRDVVFHFSGPVADAAAIGVAVLVAAVAWLVPPVRRTVERGVAAVLEATGCES